MKCSTLLSDTEDADISNYDFSFNITSTHSTDLSKEPNEEIKLLNRATPGFRTGVVGDVGTCKTNRGVMTRSSG